jgi:flavin prenyltransferase
MNDKQTNTNELPIVMGITGASGAVYAVRTLQWLLEESRRVHLVVSPDGWTVIRQELGFDRQITADTIGDLIQVTNRFMGIPETEPIVKVTEAIRNNRVKIHQPNDYFSPIASGSYRTQAMVVCPCSGTTMAAIAHSSGRNLIHRAAEVHLKERRKLIIVPRETPLSLPQIENMMRVTQAGGVVLPAAPGWYHGVTSLRDIVDFIAARILDQLGIDHARTRRWQDD